MPLFSSVYLVLLTILYIQKKKINLYYLQKLVNNFEYFDLIKITLSFFNFYVLSVELHSIEAQTRLIDLH